MPELLTKPGRLSDVARHVVVPSGVTSTGWPAVRDKCSEIGIDFDPWQDGAGRLILAKRADGSYAASIGGVVISIPRQVGKTYLIGAIVFALCLLNPGLTVLWTAHRLRTADETFAKMQAFCRRRKIAPHVKKVVLGSGDEAVMFHNGSRILFGARERGFGRGFDDVDIEVFDEAQILTENAVDDMLPAMNTAANPLPIYIGTPPKPTDPSEVFTQKRAQALSGEDEDTAYIEGSADPECDPTDREQWRRANFSYPHRTPDSAMLRMQKNLSPDSFMREALGVWDAVAASVIDLELWGRLEGKEAQRPHPVALSVVVSDDRRWSSIGLAGQRADGRVQLEIVQAGRGTGWVVPRLIELHAKWKPGWVAVAPWLPAGSLIASMDEAKLPVLKVGQQEAAQACGLIVDRTEEGMVAHGGQVQVGVAIGGADKRKSGEAWVWKPRDASVDISPLWALTLALHALGKPTSSKDRSGVVW